MKLVKTLKNLSEIKNYFKSLVTKKYFLRPLEHMNSVNNDMQNHFNVFNSSDLDLSISNIKSLQSGIDLIDYFRKFDRAKNLSSFLINISLPKIFDEHLIVKLETLPNQLKAILDNPDYSGVEVYSITNKDSQYITSLSHLTDELISQNKFNRFKNIVENIDSLLDAFITEVNAKQGNSEILEFSMAVLKLFKEDFNGSNKLVRKVFQERSMRLLGDGIGILKILEDPMILVSSLIEQVTTKIGRLEQKTRDNESLHNDIKQSNVYFIQAVGDPGNSIFDWQLGISNSIHDTRRPWRIGKPYILNNILSMPSRIFRKLTEIFDQIPGASDVVIFFGHGKRNVTDPKGLGILMSFRTSVAGAIKEKWVPFSKIVDEVNDVQPKITIFLNCYTSEKDFLGLENPSIYNSGNPEVAYNYCLAYSFMNMYPFIPSYQDNFVISSIFTTLFTSHGKKMELYEPN